LKDKVIYVVDGESYLIVKDKYCTADDLVDIARLVGVIE